LNNFLINLAQSAAPSGGASSILSSPLPMMVGIFAIFYFLVIRPQSKKAKEQQAMLADLKKGDEIVTSGGLIGKISGLTDGEVTLQVQEGVRIRITRASIQGRYGASAAAKTEPKASAS
jgi:preprotein translocase subunit YajC